MNIKLRSSAAQAAARGGPSRFAPGLLVISCVFLPLLLSGCIDMIIAGGGEGAVVAAQDRPAGQALTDAEILLKIKTQFAKQKDGDAFANVEVKVVEGRVLLSGNVDRATTEVTAVNCAWQVDAVKEVIDKITVNDKADFNNYAQDVWISTQVRTRLLWTKGIRSVNYSVLTVNQVVYLMGVAQNQQELDKATAVASTTEYVKKVISYVRLKTDPRRKS